MTPGPLDIAQPAWRFLRNLLLMSVAALTAGMALYVALRPGTAEMLTANGWPAARLLLRQTLVNGLPVVAITTWVGAVLHGAQTEPAMSHKRWLVLAAADPVIRLAVFAGLHAAIYVLAADWFGSFGGDKVTALRTVAPTLARAAWLENLSGVYLYAILAVSLPCQATAIQMAAPRSLKLGAVGPWLLVGAWNGAIIAAFTWLGRLVAA
ncbi:MAG: hypothetical protein ACU0CO_05180 [Shimia sp.]